jgi:hypothetical protein
VSGYLQRIALSVLDPGGPIRPIVGSIFSAPSPGVSVQPLRDVESVLAAEEREVLHESVPSETTLPIPEGRPRGGTQAINDHPPATRLAPVQSAIAPRFPTLDESGVESRGRDRSRADDREDRPEPFREAGEPEPQPARRAYTPLIPVTFTPSPQPFFSPPSKPKVDSSQPVASLSHATDDIEIHIGRIEVTAVQPAPVRVAPAKPQRLAASLDEYLKRRDGRSS